MRDLAWRKIMSGSLPLPGAFVRARHRHWLVEEAVPPPGAGESALVRLSCVEDDAQGEGLELLWDAEPDAEVLGNYLWPRIGGDSFDETGTFAAYLHTLRWSAVTATDPTLLQAPFRAGIKIDAYQLEPLRKALQLPRVNLFIADDVGLGKTIEAGLIARELLLRRRIDTIVVTAPPGMLLQWQEEMEARFGLSFVVLDRDYVATARRERGYGVNPWRTHNRFLVSHRLLIDEGYTADMRSWLSEAGATRPKSLLIFDEAHNAAPASGARYAIDSRFTRAMRDLAGHFEHRLFLSATPHNGYSNSFSALLEILDPQRFVRGVKVRKGDLDAIMVRRLKEDIRTVQGGFAERRVEEIPITDLPDSAPELVLARKLDRLREMREGRLVSASRSAQTAATLVISHLQQRLLSSIDAFAHTIRVHRLALERAVAETRLPSVPPAPALFAPAGLDDDTSEDPDHETRVRDEAVTDATLIAAADHRAALDAEIALVREMEEIAETHRDRPDARIGWLIEWIEREMCPRLRKDGRSWNESRLLIFTEWEATRRYIEHKLRAAIAHTDQADTRIAFYTGDVQSRAKREELKRAFNAPPDQHPLRILIATDAAREGINLQRHCRDLVHFDLPWNPSRLEQRNGRIDRKLQPAPFVTCRYFVFTQRPEDRVLDALVRKSETIRQQLGSMAQVLEAKTAGMLSRGIRQRDANRLASEITDLSDSEREAAIREELEATRERQQELQQQVDRLLRQIGRSEQAVGISADKLRHAVSVSLRLTHAPIIQAEAGAATDHPATFHFPADAPALAGDPSWAPALDLLREPRNRGEPVVEWRARAKIRPVTFEDPGELADGAVQLHLEHRVVERLLARFISQGLLHLDLSRCCLASTAGGDVRAILLGRLSLYGPRAARLHEEIIAVTARWSEPSIRRDPLRPYGAAGETRTMELLEDALSAPERPTAPEIKGRLLAALPQDVAELRPHVEQRAVDARTRAEKLLDERAARESAAMRELLQDQRRRIEQTARQAPDARQLQFAFNEAERRQLEDDRRAWQRRLGRLDEELETEPRRIAQGYRVHAARLDPVGIVYLFPVTG
jgi:ERCC4-related helicase